MQPNIFQAKDQLCSSSRSRSQHFQFVTRHTCANDTHLSLTTDNCTTTTLHPFPSENFKVWRPSRRPFGRPCAGFKNSPIVAPHQSAPPRAHPLIWFFRACRFRLVVPATCPAPPPEPPQPCSLNSLSHCMQFHNEFISPTKCLQFGSVAMQMRDPMPFLNLMEGSVSPSGSI